MSASESEYDGVRVCRGVSEYDGVRVCRGVSEKEAANRLTRFLLSLQLFACETVFCVCESVRACVLLLVHTLAVVVSSAGCVHERASQ